MLQQARMGNKASGFPGFGPDRQAIRDVKTIRIEVNRLALARYFVISMGAVLLLSLGIQALFMEEGVALSRVFKVALVALLGPGLLWAASDKEVRLLEELDTRSLQLEQRIRENKALNRMTQEHLADCFTESRAEHPSDFVQPHHDYNQPVPLLPVLHRDPEPIFCQANSALEPRSEVRSDSKNVIVLDPDDDSYDRRYFEPEARELAGRF